MINDRQAEPGRLAQAAMNWELGAGSADGSASYMCPALFRQTLVGCLVLVWLCLGRIWWLPAHAPLDPNEGWNAFHAMAVLHHAPLYPAPDALIGNNYPPLSFYLSGWLGALTGDEIVAGRLIALVALLVVAVGVALVIGRIVPGVVWAPSLGAGLFLAFNLTRFRRYVAMDDPQWLAHTCMTSGILLLLWPPRGESPSRLGVAGAAALMVGGGLVKHNLVAFPIAATLWLLIYERRGLAVWLGTAVAIGSAALLLCWITYGATFATDILAPDRRYSWLRMVTKSAAVLPWMMPMLCASGALLGKRHTDNRICLLLLLIGIALPLGVIQRSGAGVDYNAHFDTLIALSIATPVALAISWQSPRTRLILASALLAPLLILLPAAGVANVRELSTRNAAVLALQPMETRIGRLPGPVACQDQALCYWAGKTFVLDFFLIDQRLSVGHGRDMVEAAIGGHQFTAIEIEANKFFDRRDPLATIIHRGYQPQFQNGGRMLLAPN